MPRPIVVRSFTPTDGQLEEIAVLASRAFREDPYVDSMTWGDTDLQLDMYRSMCTIARQAGATFYGVFDSPDSSLDSDSESDLESVGPGNAQGSVSGNILSVTVCWGPGTNMVEAVEQYSEELHERGMGHTDPATRLCPEAIIWVQEQVYAKLLPLEMEVLGSRAVEGFHLTMVATDVNHQGEGYGTATVKKILQEADLMRSGVALQTAESKTRKRDFYEALGFKVLGQVELEGRKGKFVESIMEWQTQSV